MDTAALIKVLVEQEAHLEKQRATALARQQWHKVELLEERLEFARMLRKLIASYDTPPTS